MAKKFLYEDNTLEEKSSSIEDTISKIPKHILDEEELKYDADYLARRNFIVTPKSIGRIKKIVYYISRGVPLLLEDPSGTSKTFSVEFASQIAKPNNSLLRINMSSDTTPADILGKFVGDKSSLAGISPQEGIFYKDFKYGHPLLLKEILLSF